MIVIYHPSKARLTRDETKTGSDLGEVQRSRGGHYFTCEVCGNSGPIHTGEGSRLRAVLNARGHSCRKYKSVWRKLDNGWWTMTRVHVGYTYKCFGPELLNIAIRAATARRLDRPANVVGQ